MLFTCEIPTKLRYKLEKWLAVTISWKDIILLNWFIPKLYNELLSIITYVIFKKWLIDKERKKHEDILSFCKRDLLRRKLLYEHYEEKNKLEAQGP